MNFIIYNKITGHIAQTGYAEWQPPKSSLEYLEAQKAVKSVSSALNALELKANGLSALLADPPEGFNALKIKEELSLLQEGIEGLTLDKNTKETTLALLEEAELESYNKAKELFLASLEIEGHSAIEGEADSASQKIQISDKTIVSRERDQVNFGNMNRRIRNSLLSRSDWTQAADSPLSESDKEAWKVYRTTLRNLSQTIATFETAELDYSDLPEQP